MWNDVELLVNEDSATVRFGSAAETEGNGSSLYQVDTLVKVSSGEAATAGHFYCINGTNWGLLVADQTLILFEGNYQSILLLLHFESVVDAVDVCLEGQFLLVCERNGNLHLVFVPLKRILLTRALVVKAGDDDEDDRKTYHALVIEENKASPGLHHVFVVVADGFFHISNLPLDKIKTAVEKTDMAALKELQSLIKIDFCSTVTYHGRSCSKAVAFTLANQIHLLIGGAEEHAVTHWTVNPYQNNMCLLHSVDNSLIAGVKKMVVVGNLVYVLDTEELLSVWEVHLMVMVGLWPNVALADFELITECDSVDQLGRLADGHMKMLTLEKQYQSQTKSLRIRCLPSMSVCYCLDVFFVSCLVQTKISMDTFYFVEGVCCMLGSSGGERPSSLHIRCLTEALPETRLSRLLHKRSFEEAEKFAALFELDLELVHKVKLDFVLEQLASADDCEQDEVSRLVEEARVNLIKIDDEAYVADYCLKAPWPTWETAEKMLSHAAARFPSARLHEALARLVTFCGLCGQEKFNGVAWIKFLNSTDMFGDILSRLRNGDFRGAQLLWLKYEGQIADGFDETGLRAVLDAIPEDLPSRDLCPWFRSVFLPFVWKWLPAGQKILARWIEQRVRHLELMEKSTWPQNGLALAELGLPSLWSWMKSDGVCGSEEVENLRTLVCNLRQLLHLDAKYNCRLSLSLVEKGKAAGVAFLMLDKVAAPPLVAAAVKNHILPYAEEQGLALDELLLHYIKEMLGRHSSQTNTLFTAWEAKAVAVLGCMADTDLMADAVLEIMQKAVIPWSKLVEELVQRYLEAPGPKCELLREGYRLMEIRMILRGYGIRTYNIANSAQIMVVVNYILKRDSPTSLRDALSLVRACKLPTWHVNYLHAVRLIGRGESDASAAALKSLPAEEVTLVMERLASWAKIALEDKVCLSPDHEKEKLVIGRAMVEALKYQRVIHKNDVLKSMTCEEDLLMFQAIAQLQECFEIFTSPAEYEDPEIRNEVWERCEAVAEHEPGPRTDAGLRRLARTLRRGPQDHLSHLALGALVTDRVSEALAVLDELYKHHMDADTGEALFSAARTLCRMLDAMAEDADLPATVYQLACRAATLCHPDLLLDCLELCKSTRLSMDISHQCQLSDDYGFTQEHLSLGTEKEPYCEWLFQDFFHEDCIVLDPVSVLPVHYQMTNCLMPVSQDEPMYPLDCSCLPLCSFQDGSDYLRPLQGPLRHILQQFQECGQLESALGVLLHCYAGCLRHITSNIMDPKTAAQLYEPQRLKMYNVTLKEVHKTAASSLKSIAVALLYKVLNWRTVDVDWAMGLCTLLSKEEAFEILWKVIYDTWENYSRALAAARIGARLCHLHNCTEEMNKFLSAITDAQWGVLLAETEVSMRPVFLRPPEAKGALIPVLVENKRMDPDVILQYCSAYGLDADNVIGLYVGTVLLQEEDGDDGHARALERVLAVVPKLRQTEELVTTLAELLFKLSPYNYERIEVVLKILQAADDNVPGFSVAQATGLLQHLKSYKRTAPPSDMERAYFLEKDLSAGPLDSVRLPFHLLLQSTHYWKVITPELSEETFPTLLLISKLMKVSLDKLYMLAADRIFESKMKPLFLERQRGKDIEKVALSVMNLVRHIQNREWAAATAHKLTQELPPGYEKTQSLWFCLTVGKTWLDDPDLDDGARSRGEAFLSKVRLQLPRSGTEGVLTARGLADPELLKLGGDPDGLVAALYQHASVERRFRDSVAATYPDINAAVAEIAAINQVDLVQIQNTLLEKWICKTGSAAAEEAVNDLKVDPDLMRAVYMLQSRPAAKALCLLSAVLSAETWPLSRSGPRLTYCHRTRALFCLVRLADAQDLESHLKIPAAQLEQYLRCYVWVSRLEALNIPYTLSSFMSSPKEGLIKGLWKNRSHEPQAVRLVAELCLEYKVYDPQLWNALLQKMLCFNLIDDLQKVLESTVAVPDLWEIPSFSRTWKSTLLAPFASASLPLNVDQRSTLRRTFALLLKCPLLSSVNLNGIAQGFDRLNLLPFALGTLLLIPCAGEKEQRLQAFLSEHEPLAILEQEDLVNTGEFAGIPWQIREIVSTYMIRRGQDGELAKTNQLPVPPVQ
ncbi:kinetochore-associated protein 1 [Corythoichthys intestinalis]|uniref:kinetochore-associated protein 1 n=1 Tax=Corythoichthys intestinalis TaxID=161448 RepID=UPI0025A605D1|nr:kinetochore-associated protein 1 [Corythoichthys intestinalis]